MTLLLNWDLFYLQIKDMEKKITQLKEEKMDLEVAADKAGFLEAQVSHVNLETGIKPT